MAFGGLQYCEGRDLNVSGDIGIAGWGDLQIAQVLKKRLTSMHVFHLKLGQKAAEMMIGRPFGEAVCPCHDIGFQLIFGMTVKMN